MEKIQKKRISRTLTFCLLVGALTMSKMANAQCPPLKHFRVFWTYCDADGSNERAMKNVCVGDVVYLKNKSKYGTIPSTPSTPGVPYGAYPIPSTLVSGKHVFRTYPGSNQVFSEHVLSPQNLWKYDGVIARTATVSGNLNLRVTYYGDPNTGCGATSYPYPNYNQHYEQLYSAQSPIVTISPQLPETCPGQPITLTASGNSSYIWSTGQIGNSITVSPSVATTYTVTGNGNCTSPPVSVTVEMKAVPVFSLPKLISLCPGDPFPNLCKSVMYFGDSYNWTSPDHHINGSTGCYQTTQTGTYCLEVSSSLGCSSTACVVVENDPLKDYEPTFINVPKCITGNVDFSVTSTYSSFPLGLSQRFIVYRIVSGNPIYQITYTNPPSSQTSFTLPFVFIQGQEYIIKREVWSPDCGAIKRDQHNANCDARKGEGNNSRRGAEAPEEDESNSLNEMISLNVSPNPNNGQFTIELNNNEEKASVVVYDLMGKIVYSKNSGQNIQKIDISEQAKGIYFVRVSIGEQVFNEKVIYQ